MDIPFTSAVVLLLLVFDPFGNIPLFIAALKNIDPKRHNRIILRECFIAWIALLFFLVCGKQFLSLLQLSQTSLGIAGGVILFLIAIRMIFSHPTGIFGDLPGGEPFIVPLAIPSVVGPSAIAIILLFISKNPDRLPEWISAATLALLISTIILLFSGFIHKLIGERGTVALERLMGLILTAVSVEMFLKGIEEFVRHLH